MRKLLNIHTLNIVGLLSKEMYSKDMYQSLINKIRAKCFITDEEERELKELITNRQ